MLIARRIEHVPDFVNGKWRRARVNDGVAIGAYRFHGRDGVEFAFAFRVRQRFFVVDVNDFDSQARIAFLEINAAHKVIEAVVIRVRDSPTACGACFSGCRLRCISIGRVARVCHWKEYKL